MPEEELAALMKPGEFIEGQYDTVTVVEVQQPEYVPTRFALTWPRLIVISLCCPATPLYAAQMWGSAHGNVSSISLLGLDPDDVMQTAAASI